MNFDFLTQFWGALSSSEKIAVVGIVVAWIVYRADRFTQRGGLLNGIKDELALHKPWLGKPYLPNSRASFTDKSHMPYKLGTVAIDDAIARGPSLFLNNQLSASLVVYRQLVGHFNQLVDQTMALQAAPELWLPNPPPDLEAEVLTRIAAIHILGIGDLTTNKAAHWSLVELLEPSLKAELDSKVLPWVWAVSGFNLFFLKRWEQWL